MTGLAAQDAAAALTELLSVQRETVLLRYFQDLSMNKIAELLGIRVGTVKSRPGASEKYPIFEYGSPIQFLIAALIGLVEVGLVWGGLRFFNAWQEQR